MRVVKHFNFTDDPVATWRNAR